MTYAKLHHDMQHFVNEATVEQLNQIKKVFRVVRISNDLLV